MAERISYDGVMAARIDRLPLTQVQWHLAILVEVTWGFIIFDTDGIAPACIRSSGGPITSSTWCNTR